MIIRSIAVLFLCVFSLGAEAAVLHLSGDGAQDGIGISARSWRLIWRYGDWWGTELIHDGGIGAPYACDGLFFDSDTEGAGLPTCAEAGVPNQWGPAAQYSATINDVTGIGTLSWTGASGVTWGNESRASGLSASSITDGNYVFSGYGIDTAANGTFDCWNEPISVYTLGADFCGNGSGGATDPGTPGAAQEQSWHFKSGLQSVVDNGDGTASLSLLTDGRYICELDPECSTPDTDELIVYTLNIDAKVIPVPATFWLFGSALGFLGWIKRRKSITG
jgi:hypothetical protein